MCYLLIVLLTLRFFIGQWLHRASFQIRVNIKYKQYLIMSSQIVIARQQHAESIINFQLNMALQTQNFKLDAEIVSKAVNYFISLNSKEHMSHLGFYLVKLVDGKAVASLLLTFQSAKRWWIQSVYVDKSCRRQGHFTSLFNKSIQIAKQKGVKSVKLYAQSQNKNAKEAYFKLGMKTIEGQIYSYDFVYGGSTLSEGNHSFKFESDHKQLQVIKKWMGNKENVLSTKTQIDTNKDLVVISLNEEIVGVAKYFQEFSDWRFGIMRYVGQIYLADQSNLQQIIPGLIAHLVKTSQIKVAVIRFIASEQVASKLTGGHLDHYDILQIKIE